jgi:uncharacterized protein
MPKRLINKYLPAAHKVTEHRSLKWLGVILHDTKLWHLNRRSVASAFFVGIFSCFIPIPFQMLLAAALAIYFHCNLPISVSLVWLTNPLTYAPVFYLNYRFGLLVMGLDYDPSDFVWKVESMGDNLALIWQPFLLGSVLAGLIVGGLAYLLVRLLWRLHIQHTWFKRRAQRARQFGNNIRNSSIAFTAHAKQKGKDIKSEMKNSCDALFSKESSNSGEHESTTAKNPEKKSD